MEAKARELDNRDYDMPTIIAEHPARLANPAPYRTGAETPLREDRDSDGDSHMRSRSPTPLTGLDPLAQTSLHVPTAEYTLPLPKTRIRSPGPFSGVILQARPRGLFRMTPPGKLLPQHRHHSFLRVARVPLPLPRPRRISHPIPRLQDIRRNLLRPPRCRRRHHRRP